MCSLCDDNGGEMEACQECGFLICFDEEDTVDVIRRAYVTASGDLFCARCGSRHDKDAEEDEEEEEEDQDELLDDEDADPDEEDD